MIKKNEVAAVEPKEKNPGAESGSKESPEFDLFKRDQGCSEPEISVKHEALKNVLPPPCRVEENIDLLSKRGSKEAETYFRRFNFASFVAFKE
jgi:hypothetical protein